MLHHVTPGRESLRTSAIYRVVDSELHYYRNNEENETTRILVLRRESGYNNENIRIFVETSSGVRQLELDKLHSASRLPHMSDATARHLKATLAIIKLDLTRLAGAE